MAKSARFAVQFRRRRAKKTNYRKRIGLLKSDLPRLVLRKTTRGFHAQIIKSHESEDRTIHEATAAELKKFGYKGSLGTTPAAYLTGYLLGKKSKDIKKAIPDFGLSHPKSERLLAAVRGAIDSGMDIPMGKTHLKEERMIGTHLKVQDEVKRIKEMIEKEVKV